MIARLALPIAAMMVQLAAALLALGPPDPRLAVAFLSTGAPTAAQSLAAAQLLVWTVIAVGIAISLGTVVAEALSRAAVRRRLWEATVVAVGLLLLAAGALRHFTYEPSLAGGTVQEARNALGH